nr:lysozyme inhibitor LprI family protein [Solitalea longa]
MNEKAAKEYQKTDKELNTVYQKVLKEYSADTAFVKNLKIAQRIWIQFRDAEMLAKYPNREDGYYGSMQPICWFAYKTELTLDRIKKLKVWLAGTEDGDGCSGSVKIKN